MRNHSIKEQGIGLIEVIAALGIAIIVITALVSLSVVTLRASLTSNLLLQGSKRANEELELVRAYRDRNDWASFRSSLTSCTGSTHCYITDGFTVGTGDRIYDQNTVRQINRYFQVSDPTDGVINGNESLLRISVSASWTIGSATKYAHVYTDLSNWRSN